MDGAFRSHITQRKTSRCACRPPDIDFRLRGFPHRCAYPFICNAVFPGASQGRRSEVVVVEVSDDPPYRVERLLLPCDKNVTDGLDMLHAPIEPMVAAKLVASRMVDPLDDEEGGEVGYDKHDESGDEGA